MNIFAIEYIRPKYLNVSNIRLFAQYYFGLFGPFLYFVKFRTHIEPFWTENNHFSPFLGKNENSNIFPIIGIGQMNI